MLPTQLFAFGFGFVATDLASIESDGVSAPAQSAAPRWRALRSQGWAISLWPGPDPAPSEGAAWLISIPPDEAGCRVFRAFEDRSASASWIGYLSTTGVYGDLSGRWAFEETPLSPQSREAINRARAEEQWLNAGANIFRLPAYTGPVARPSIASVNPARAAS
jgi:hypothetical protein